MGSHVQICKFYDLINIHRWIFLYQKVASYILYVMVMHGRTSQINQLHIQTVLQCVAVFSDTHRHAYILHEEC